MFSRGRSTLGRRLVWNNSAKKLKINSFHAMFHLYIPSENVGKPLEMFSGGTEMEYWREMGQ